MMHQLTTSPFSETQGELPCEANGERRRDSRWGGCGTPLLSSSVTMLGTRPAWRGEETVPLGGERDDHERSRLKTKGSGCLLPHLTPGPFPEREGELLRRVIHLRRIILSCLPDCRAGCTYARTARSLSPPRGKTGGSRAGGERQIGVRPRLVPEGSSGCRHGQGVRRPCPLGEGPRRAPTPRGARPRLGSSFGCTRVQRIRSLPTRDDHSTRIPQTELARP
jgi:hypothetical protein